MTIQIFISYSHRDQEYVLPGEKYSLVDFLGELKDSSFWFDEMILTGEAWDQVIRKRIADSQIALIMVSNWFLNSPYVKNSEIPRFLEQRKNEGMVIFPIIVGPCNWNDHPWLAATQSLPKGGETLIEHYSRRAKRERLYLQIKEELERQIGRLTAQRQQWPVRQERMMPSGVGSRAEAFGSVDHFVEEGDHISAINHILDGRSYQEISTTEQLDVAVICQKLGLLDKARHYADIILSLPGWKLIQEDVQARFRLLNLKILSQEGRFNEFLELYSDVVKQLLRTGQEERIPQILHRAGVAFAAIYDLASAQKCFEEALGYAVRHANRHAEITSGVLRAIAQAFRGVPPLKNDEPPLTFVAHAQELYLSEPTEKSLWQANRFKSVVQSLFSEAAMLLAGDAQASGWVRLTAAHLLGPRAKSHPQSEGYAELLALIDRGDIREPLRLAMYTDDQKRDEFQHRYLEHTSYLADCLPVMKILNSPTIGEWRQLRLLFHQVDQRHGGTRRQV